MRIGGILRRASWILRENASPEMIALDHYLIFTEDREIAREAYVVLNRLAEKKALPHRGYVIVRGERIGYELRGIPQQLRTF